MNSKTSSLSSLTLLAGLLASGLAQAQSPSAATAPASRPSSLGWQACQAIQGNDAGQLACYQQWAQSQLPANTPPASITTAPANVATGQPETPILLLPALNTDAPDGKPIGCRNTQYSELSRFWELQRGTDCDTFSIRGYRPISLALALTNGSNTPQVDEAVRNAGFKPQTLKNAETKIQLSVRTKVAKGLLKTGDADESDQDSLWFGYTQQSYWQLFTPGESRPFRTTDHEPEVIYIYPHQLALPGGWQYRLSGLGLVHQSNGQSNLLSRSWNRVYLMGALEKTLGPESSLRVQGRIWNRLRESSGNDDNPGIENYIGRAELNATWQVNKANTLGVTVRHSLHSQARGSTRIDWMMAPAASPTYTGLRYHVQLFSGYGDSLLDYNRRRNVLSLGLSLVDW